MILKSRLKCTNLLCSTRSRGDYLDILKNVLSTIGFLGFYKGNIIKYILRDSKKNGLEDYKKARQYLDWYIQELESDQVTYGQMTYMEDEMERELTPEEDEEYLYLIKK